MELPPCAQPEKLRAEIECLPARDREDATQEAWLAHADGRDPIAAVWAFAKREQRYRQDHIQMDVDEDGEAVGVDADGSIHKFAAPRQSESSAASVRRNSPIRAA